MDTTNILPLVLYKYLPPIVAEKFLSRGLSYSRPMDFTDKKEFLTKFVRVSNRELLSIVDEFTSNTGTQSWAALLSERAKLRCELSAILIKSMSRRERLLYLENKNAELQNLTPRKLKIQLSSICRVCSLTTWENSEMMWKDYAQDSTGVKLSFQTEVLSKPEFGTLRPVTYSSKLPPYNPAYCTPHGEHLMRIIYTKQLSFAAEREVRLCVNIWTPQHVLYQGLYGKEVAEIAGVKREYSYYHPIQSCLKTVTFGCNCSDETKARISTLLYQKPNAEHCISLAEYLRSALTRLDSNPKFQISTVDELVEKLSMPIRSFPESHLKDCATVWALLNQLKIQLAPIEDNLLLDVMRSNSWQSQMHFWLNIPRFHHVRVDGI